MLDLLDEGHDLVRCRCAMWLLTVGEGSAGDMMCAGGCCRCCGAPEVDAGLVAVDTCVDVVGAGSRTLPVVVATLGLFRSTPTDGVL